MVLANPLWADDTVLDVAPFERLIAGRDVSFMAGLSGDTCVLADSDLETRHAPWSTFKIPNLMIALETGVAADLGAHRQWDAARYPSTGFGPMVWFRDHTLLSAFQVSAVWYFREVARDVGTARYRAMLHDWNYGNAQVQMNSDRFWLNEGLKISVAEQVAFVTRLLDGRLQIADATRRALADAAWAGRSGDTVLFGKTGSGPARTRGTFEGWYVGWVTKPGVDVPFALYAEAGSYAALRDFRKAFAIRLLKACGALPAQF